MSLSGWIVAGAILIIIFLVALGIGWWIRNHHPPPAPPSAYTSPLVWSQPIPSSNTEKNTCQLYTFPTAIAEVNGVSTVIPGSPTFNSAILDNLQGRERYPRCLDTDQIMAQQVTHTCVAPNGVVDGSITRCFTLTGDVVDLGVEETYYTDTTCSRVYPCPGQLSLVSINFQAPTITDIYCLQHQGKDANIIMAPCDPTNSKQLFRVTRINPGQNPNTLQPGQSQNGLLAQILDRDTGLCVVPGNSANSTIYSPDYLAPVYSNCIGENVTVSGSNVILSECTGEASGYVWALLPPLDYCPSTSGCTGCSGCQGCVSIPGEFRCEGCDGCQGNPASVTLPQIVNISNLDITQIPSGTYKGLTGSSAIVQWLRDNNAQSMYYGGEGDGLILSPFGYDSTMCNQKPYTAQYINLASYNSIIEQEACLTSGASDCIGFAS